MAKIGQKIFRISKDNRCPFSMDFQYLFRNVKAMSIGAKQRELVELFDFVLMEVDIRGGYFNIHLKNKSSNSLRVVYQ